MYLRQFYLGCLAHASYLIADEETKLAVVVDPQRDIDIYVDEAEKHGFQIGHVFLTHFHADFVAGHLELREKYGVPIYLGARAEAEYDFQPVGDGYRLDLGQVQLRVLETPGHTPEGISILVYDLAKSDTEPQAVLTGDTLFIGDVGRPDLLASFGLPQAELASMLYDSLRYKLLRLPDSTLVYPAHGSGSMCGKNLSKETVSTMGDQRKYNYALRPMTKDEFISLVSADQPDAPKYFSYDAQLNRQERNTLEKALHENLKALSWQEVLRLGDENAQILDTRDGRDFAASHLKGSINISLSGSYATWAGSILKRERPIVLVADSGREEESALRLGRIGFDHVAGYLKGGMLSLAHRPELIGKIERMSAQRAKEELNSPEKPKLLDVRTEKEWKLEHIEEAENIPLAKLEEEGEKISDRHPLLVYCASGYRSLIAVSLLRKAGREYVYDLAGGIAAWKAHQES